MPEVLILGGGLAGSIVARLLTSSDRERFHRIEDVLARLESTTV